MVVRLFRMDLERYEATSRIQYGPDKVIYSGYIFFLADQESIVMITPDFQKFLVLRHRGINCLTHGERDNLIVPAMYYQHRAIQAGSIIHNRVLQSR